MDPKRGGGAGYTHSGKSGSKSNCTFHDERAIPDDDYSRSVILSLSLEALSLYYAAGLTMLKNETTYPALTFLHCS